METLGTSSTSSTSRPRSALGASLASGHSIQAGGNRGERTARGRSKFRLDSFQGIIGLGVLGSVRDRDRVQPVPWPRIGESVQGIGVGGWHRGPSRKLGPGSRGRFAGRFHRFGVTHSDKVGSVGVREVQDITRSRSPPGGGDTRKDSDLHRSPSQ